MRKITCVILAAATLTLVGCQTSSRYGRSTGEFIDDRTVTANVKGALGDDSLTEAAPIRVDTFRGNVHLTGFVDHPIQKDRASEITRRVPGVGYFKNDIIIKNQMPAQGRMIEAAGAQSSDQTMRSSSEAQSTTTRSSSAAGGASGWQRGSYNSFGEFRGEPAGAEVEMKQERRERYETPKNQ